jgi:hypothetical protein
LEISVCGDVIVTDPAIVLVAPDPTRTKAFRAGAIVAGTAAGGALGGALAGHSGSAAGGSLLNLGDAGPVPPLAEMKRVTTCWPSEIPVELSGLTDWPRIPETRPVTLYPRAAIGVVRLSWTGEMSITLSGIGPDVEASVNFWQVSKAKKHLHRAGYRLE